MNDGSPVPSDALEMVDAPLAMDAPAPVDAPAPIDAPAPMDVPAPVDAPPPMDVPAPVDAPPPMDASMPVDAPPSDAGPVVLPQSQVVVGEYDVAGSAGAFAFASFGGTIFGTPTAASGECALYAPLTAPGGTKNAGTITVTGTMVPVVTLTPTPMPPYVGYSYTPNPLPVDLYPVGAVVQFTGWGGPDVPAFSDLVIAPPPVTGAVFPASLSRSAPATVTWVPEVSTSLWIWIAAFDPGGSSQHTLFCIPRAGDTGSYTVSPAALSLIPPAETMGAVIVLRSMETWVMAGTYAVDLTVMDQRGSGVVPIGF